jgi:uncharacterized protein (TIGR02300 family)
MTIDPALGAKRTCENEACGIRFHDLNKRPATCPRCKQKVTITEKVYSRRTRRTAGDKPAESSLLLSKVIVADPMPKRAKRRFV